MASALCAAAGGLKPLVPEEVDRWLRLGNLPACDVGLPFREPLRDVPRRHLTRLQSAVGDVRVCQYIVALSLTVNSHDWEDLARSTAAAPASVWVWRQKPLQEAARVQLRGMRERRALFGAESHHVGLRASLQLLLHDIRFRDAGTLVVREGSLGLRCAACEARLHCSLDMLVEMPIARLPAGLALTEAKRAYLARAVWQGHNEALKREVAGWLPPGALPWWADDDPDGVPRAALQDREFDDMSLRTVCRAAEAYGAEPDRLVSLVRERPTSARPAKVRQEMSGVLRARDPCDKVRAVWRLGEVCRARLLEMRLVREHADLAGTSRAPARVGY